MEITKEEIQKGLESKAERARLAESLKNSSAWQSLFLPLILDKKIEYYKNIANCVNLEAHKEAHKALQSLKVDLEEYINQGFEAQKDLDKLKE